MEERNANGDGSQWTGTSILKWACIKLWPAARSALNQSNNEGSSLRTGLKIDSRTLDCCWSRTRLDSGMGSTGWKDRTGLARVGRPEMGCHPHARHVSVIGKLAPHRDVVLWREGPVKSDAS